MQPEHFRNRGSAPSAREPQVAVKDPPPSRFIPEPQTPSAGDANGSNRSVKSEPDKPLIPAQKMQQLPPPQQQQTNVSANRPQGPLVPQVPLLRNKPVESVPLSKTSPTRIDAPKGAPLLDSSITAEHNPPVGFFTARAAESLQKGSALPSNVPVFNPHLESPSIRKTAGVDHSKTKPVRTESLGAPLAAIPPRTNFINPQTDKTRRVGMPTGVASPLKNRGSYKPPQMKRPADETFAQ